MAELDGMPELVENTSLISSINKIEGQNENLSTSSTTENRVRRRSSSSSGGRRSSGSEENEEDWEMMEEESDEPEDTECLFCDRMTDNPTLMLSHMMSQHSFNLHNFVTEIHKMEQIEYIKFVNYVRQMKPNSTDILQLDSTLWSSDDYMKPVLPNDHLVMLDIEEADPSNCVNGERRQDYGTLQNKCDELREIVDRQRKALKRFLEKEESRKPTKVMKTASDLDIEEDEGYFNSYAYFDIHHEMLSDKTRTEAYRDAILNNGAMLKNKSVLDLGCGTAILSMFCAKVGARVTGIDMSEVIYHAMDIIKENGLEDSVILEKGRVEDIEFEEKFDFIVSEWMGYFLLFEGMLDSVIYARNHHLAPGGMLMPNRCAMYLVGLEDLVAYDKFVSFWDDVYGFKMTCMRHEVITEATTEVVKKECVCTSPVLIADLDLMKISPKDTEFTTPFTLPCLRDGVLTGFVGYFDTFFDLPNSIQFSTGPHSTPTHWKQTIFYLPKPRPIKKDEALHGTISVRRKKKEVRSLDVVISFDGKRFNYFVE